MGMLDRLAHGDEELESLPRREVVLVAVPCDRHALDEVHDKVRPARAGGTGIKYACDVRVVHQVAQGLAARPRKSGDDLLRVHPRLDEFDGHQAFDRLGLLRHPYGAHAAFADLLNQLVRADDRAGAFADRHVEGRVHVHVRRSPLHEAGGPDVGPQERLDRGPQRRVIAACLLQVGRALLGVLTGQRLVEDLFFAHVAPRRRNAWVSTLQCEKRRSEHQEFPLRAENRASGLRAEAQLAAEPGPRVGPLPIGAAGRDPQDRGRLVARQPREIA